MKKRLPIRHPGIVLQDEFIRPRKLTIEGISASTGIHTTTLIEISEGDRDISIETGLKLAVYFDLSEDYFIRMQYQYEIDRIKDDKEGLFENIKPYQHDK